MRSRPTKHLPPAIYYDEWNADRGSYIRSGAAVRIYEPTSASSSWLREELQQQAATARQIRHQFERLRARRTLSVRQQRGDALDLAACVEAMTARRMGDAPDDRLYIDARPGRRGLAISLLIDERLDGSARDRSDADHRHRKIALLLATQALDAWATSRRSMPSPAGTRRM
jgi:nitric oxide reductase activation protein